MKLNHLLAPWFSALPEAEVLHLQEDSRRVSEGSLFFAYPGLKQDGRHYLSQAQAQGAVASLYEAEQLPENFALPRQGLHLAVPQLSQKLGEIAARFYDYPSKALSMTGITGTNGKTSIAYQLAQSYEYLGLPAAYIGTLGQGPIAEIKAGDNTTPHAFNLQHFLNDYQRRGVKKIAMEVSSHALVQGRVEGIDFQQAIFTNLSHDHLDYHQNMANYAAAKAKLFEKQSLKFAIINQDDLYAKQMYTVLPSSCQLISYGLKEGAMVFGKVLELQLAQSEILVQSPWGEHTLSIPAPGLFNIYNALALFSSLAAEGYPIPKLLALLKQLKAAPGRMERVASEPFVFVDYAHTPDALKNVLSILQTVKKGKIILVFGCGGDRDRLKRPEMGKIASLYADLIILTNDNPRTESPESIVEDIAAGMKQRSKKEVYHILDREKAITKALSLAETNDLILIAGKGHETYQEIQGERSFFSDQALVKSLVV